ncbi:MAG: hypothetical protein ACOX3H_01700 [Saccharofermentanales bacterium]|jgi:hypothetical protein
MIIYNANRILRSVVLFIIIVSLCAISSGCDKLTKKDSNQRNSDLTRMNNNRSSAEHKKQYNTVSFNTETTTESSASPDATTASGEATTSSGEATTAETSSPTTNQTQPPAPAYEIVSKWEMSLVIIRNRNVLQGTLAREWESKIECRVELGKITEDTYKMYLTPVSIVHNEEVLDSTKIRQGPIEYDAKIYNNILVFELESEFFALANDYNLGSIKPVRCSLWLEGAENSRTASERQIHRDVDGQGDVIEVRITIKEVEQPE